MITQKDLDIKNISYTNKDFAQIYPELLDLTKRLTDKWNPETSDESDPGVVLLKLLAFMGDKLSYNIDKNILERFIPSATQENSVDSLYEILGYNRHYYKSATTELSFSYNGAVNANGGFEDFSTDSQLVDSFSLPAFDTSFKTEEGIVYTLLEDIDITTTSRKSSDKLCIQGELRSLTATNTSTDTSAVKIIMANLDENNRVYFPDKMVCENGVFINKEYYSADSSVNNDGDYWRRVDNLNDVDLGTKCYKFGYDSERGLPYLEFPQDINTLIGDGIEIWYIVTTGLVGKAKMNSLTELNSFVLKYKNGTLDATKLTKDSYSISNTESISAANPETLNQSYNNFKKTIGTFNTIVSKRDYTNAIYTAVANDNTHYVSNDHVEDNVSDQNNGWNVLTRNSNATVNVNFPYVQNSGNADNSGDSSNNGQTSLRTYYNNIYLYATKPSKWDIIDTTESYDYTYNLIDITDLNNVIIPAFENYKVIGHNFTLPSSNDIALIFNNYKLNVLISTKYKVNTLEQADVLNNVKIALYNAFNAREVDFGEKIPYSAIVSCIEGADSRIKNVFVDTPEIYTSLEFGDRSEVKYDLDNIKNLELENADKTSFIIDPTSPNRKVNIILNNIASGAMTYLYDDGSYSYDYTQQNLTYYPAKNTTPQLKLKYVCGKFDLKDDSANKALIGYDTDGKLQKNEIIEVLSDSFITKKSATAYVYYYLHLKDNTQSIKDGSIYELKTGEELWFYHTDSDNKLLLELHKAGEHIRPNGFDLIDTDKLSETSTAPRYIKISAANRAGGVLDSSDLVDYQNKPNDLANWHPMTSLLATQSIDLVDRNTITMTSRSQQLFIYLNPTIYNDDGKLLVLTRIRIGLDDDFKYVYILEKGEYVIYPDNQGTTLAVLGEGTKLEFSKDIKSETSNSFLKSKEVNGVTIEYIENKAGPLISDNSALVQSNLLKVVSSGSMMQFNNLFDLSSKPDMLNYDFSGKNSLTIVETVKDVYGENDLVKISSRTGINETTGVDEPLIDYKTILEDDSITNNGKTYYYPKWKKISENALISLGESSDVVSSLGNVGDILIRKCFSIVGDKNSSQELLPNQSIGIIYSNHDDSSPTKITSTFTSGEDTIEEIKATIKTDNNSDFLPFYVQFNVPIDTNIPLYLNVLGLFPYSLISYTLKNNEGNDVFSISSENNTNVSLGTRGTRNDYIEYTFQYQLLDKNGIKNIVINGGGDNFSTTLVDGVYTINFGLRDNQKVVLYMYSPNANSSYGGNSKSFVVNKDTVMSNDATKNNVPQYIQDLLNINNVNMKDGTLFISAPMDLRVNQAILDLDNNTYGDLQRYLDANLDNVGYDYLGYRNKSKMIDSENIFGPNWFFDVNNVYNQYVISKIDFSDSGSTFKIVGASKK